MDDLIKLAERCEQADAGTILIDSAISGAMGNTDIDYYTTSLDAAMTLVPEGWRWWKAGDNVTGGSRMVVADTQEDGRFTVLGECPCPDTVERNALALCAAALRARAAVEVSDG